MLVAISCTAPETNTGPFLARWLYEQDGLTSIFSHGRGHKLKSGILLPPPVHRDWLKMDMWVNLCLWESGQAILLDLFREKKWSLFTEIEAEGI